MVVHGVQEQKWNRSTSNSGLSKLLLMQRYEDTFQKLWCHIKEVTLLEIVIKLNVVFYMRMFM